MSLLYLEIFFLLWLLKLKRQLTGWRWNITASHTNLVGGLDLACPVPYVFFWKCSSGSINDTIPAVLVKKSVLKFHKRKSLFFYCLLWLCCLAWICLRLSLCYIHIMYSTDIMYTLKIFYMLIFMVIARFLKEKEDILLQREVWVEQLFFRW